VAAAVAPHVSLVAALAIGGAAGLARTTSALSAAVQALLAKRPAEENAVSYLLNVRERSHHRGRSLGSRLAALPIPSGGPGRHDSGCCAPRAVAVAGTCDFTTGIQARRKIASVWFTGLSHPLKQDLASSVSPKPTSSADRVLRGGGLVVLATEMRALYDQRIACERRLVRKACARRGEEVG
jgi:hypothetical protein